MKKNLTYSLKLSEDIAKKLAYVSESEGLSIQNMLTTLIRQKIQYFERVKGNIKPQALQGVDLTQFSISSDITEE
ncbi:MAG: hypothetical protein IJW54_03995 [Clostridia bacterium]|nr:hypothetical protein [Clostridia bacterium]